MRASRAFATTALALVISCAAVGAAPSALADDYRTLGTEGLLAVSLDASLSPPWFPAVRNADRAASAAENRITACVRGEGDEYIRATEGPVPTTRAYGFINYGRLPTEGYMNMIQRIYEFATVQDAQAAMRALRAAVAACTKPYQVPYYEEQPDGSFAVVGKIVASSTTSNGDIQYGRRSLIIDSTSYGTRDGQSSPDRTGSGYSIFRVVGRAITEVEASKALMKNVKTALSLQERTTVNALSQLVTERYHVVATAP